MLLSYFIQKKKISKTELLFCTFLALCVMIIMVQISMKLQLFGDTISTSNFYGSWCQKKRLGDRNLLVTAFGGAFGAGYTNNV